MRTLLLPLALMLTFGGACASNTSHPHKDMAASHRTEPAAASTTQAEPLSAKESNPMTMGWMTGFPPEANKTIRFTDPDYFVFPKLRWTMCNFRQLMPNVAVANGTGGALALPTTKNFGIDDVTFTPLNSDAAMTWNEAFDANYTDGVIVLHHGRVVYERYDGCLAPDRLHGAMSVTKSLTGLLGEMLVAEGALDDSARVGTVIPELKASAFGDATVRQVMDMTTALDYSEDYSDPNADIWIYSEAGSPLPKPDGYTGPRSYFEFLETVEKKGVHGDAFGYKTVNADVLGWLISRATGKSVNELLSERIWTTLGTEREAFYTVDSIGTPFAGGGFNATLRDLARFGQMLLDNGQVDGLQIVAPEAIASIRQQGDPSVFAAAGYATLPGWSYRSMWWVSNDDHGAYAARGVHGQTIWIDPTADMVIVRFASNPVAANAASDPTSLPAYRAIAEYLMTQDDSPLLGQEWRVEDIAGEGIIDRSHATITFLPDGRVAGSATCNGFVGAFEHDGEKVRVDPSGLTRKACAEALMNQERKFLAILSKITRYQMDDTGALILTTVQGKTITLRR